MIDTMARVVSGGENETDTYRAFYRFTGGRLKADGRSLLRLDHEGKKGEDQRGSNEKNDDVDVVFRLATLPGNIVKLTRTHTRVPWVPAVVTIVRNDAPLLRHVWTDDAVPAGTYDCIRALDELDVPPNSAPTPRSRSCAPPAGQPTEPWCSRHSGSVGSGQRERFRWSGNRPSGDEGELSGNRASPQCRLSCSSRFRRFREPLGTVHRPPVPGFPPSRGEPDQGRSGMRKRKVRVRQVPKDEEIREVLSNGVEIWTEPRQLDPVQPSVAPN